jgi:predicted PurR-regulated permease PerM
MSLPVPSTGQARVIWLALTGLAIAVLVALLAGLIWGLSQVLQILSPVLWPLAVAGVLAYLLDPVVDLLEAKGVPRPRAILCVFALAFVIVATLLSSVVPQLVSETRDLAERIPGYATSIQERAERWLSHPPPWVRKLLHSNVVPVQKTVGDVSTNATPDILTTNTPAAITTNAPSLVDGIDKEALQTATGLLTSVLPRAGTWLTGQLGRVASWVGILAGLALIPVYTFYFLLEKQGIRSRWSDYLPLADSRFKEELVFVLGSINNYLIAFFRGQVLVAVCDGILYTIGFLSIRLPYAVVIGALAIALTMIPFLGAIITCCLALILAFVQFGDWLHPLLVLVVFAIVQTVEGLVISPKIMGGRVGLHPVTIIIAVMVGTTLLGGLLGGILAIPLTAALRVVMFRYIWKRGSA